MQRSSISPVILPHLDNKKDEVPLCIEVETTNDKQMANVASKILHFIFFFSFKYLFNNCGQRQELS